MLQKGGTHVGQSLSQLFTVLHFTFHTKSRTILFKYVKTSTLRGLRNLTPSQPATMAVSGKAYFKEGAEVEVRSVRGGAFIPATIIAKSSSGTSFLVEYKTLKPKASIGVEKNEVKPLMEELDASLLRPSLPREREDYAYQPGQEVDAYHNGRWWEGVITEILEGSSKISVYLHVQVELEFEPSRLRPHREWVEGKWVPPLQDKNVSASIGAKAAEESLVEVRIDEEGFEGSWYAAKIIQDVGEDKYLVQYRTIRTDTGEKFLKEEVDKRNIRPYPPQTIMIDRYDQNEEVDAFHNDGWWEGVISKILSRGMYRVYFEHTDEEIVFEHSDLRLRQNWVNDTWVLASQEKTMPPVKKQHV